MSIHSVEYIDLAKDILKIQTEAAYRTAACRAYYAGYHYSKDIADGLDDAGGNGMHDSHIRKFTESLIPKVRAIGYMLQQCHSIRVKADYKLELDFGAVKAEEAISASEKLIEKIDEIT